MNKIFGYDWEDIQRAQRGGTLRRNITSKPASDMTDERISADLDLLRKHGVQGLHDMQFYGVIDRLQRAGHID